jgi:hypothetical protein
VLTVSVQRDRAADRVIGAEPFLVPFDPEFLVEEAPQTTTVSPANSASTS